MLFARQLLSIECGILQDVSENIDRKRRVLSQDTRVVIGVFDACGSVQLTTDGLDLFCDATRRAGLGALEGHMLQKMGYPVLVHILRAGSGSHPHAKSRRFQMRHLVGDDRHPVIEDCCLYFHMLTPQQ